MTLWDQIKKQYPDKVEARLKGQSETIDEQLFHLDVSHQIVEEGEIKKDFDVEIENFEQENREKRYKYTCFMVFCKEVLVFSIKFVSKLMLAIFFSFSN